MLWGSTCGRASRRMARIILGLMSLWVIVPLLCYTSHKLNEKQKQDIKKAKIENIAEQSTEIVHKTAKKYGDSNNDGIVSLEEYWECSGDIREYCRYKEEEYSQNNYRKFHNLELENKIKTKIKWLENYNPSWKLK